MALDQHQAAAQSYTCRGAQGYAGDFGGRGTLLWRPQWLEAIAADPHARAGRIAAARQALQRGPYSVTHKSSLVPGASRHDYTSIGPYWWPDPDQADGLPYTRRDGEVNPERIGPAFDKGRLSQVGADVEALAIGYYLTRDIRYAEHAARLLDTWFLDPATRMAPNMDFAQGIPGRVKGRAEGIIEASDLSTVIESVGLIAPSGALSPTQRAGLKGWYAQFVNWLQTSENGLAESRKDNNHAVFYDFYLAHFALFAGDEGIARAVIADFPDARLAPQMDEQGRFPLELERTRSWHYSNYILAGAGRLATIAECLDADLWSAKLNDGRGLSEGLAFLQSFSHRVEDWPFPDRDHTAQKFDKMRRGHELVATLFGPPERIAPHVELP